jgi:hypothetical protein
VFGVLIRFYCVLCEKATFIRVFLKSLVICLTSLPQYITVVHFVIWCLGSACMFCFWSCGSGLSITFVLYSLFHSMILMVFFCIFDLLVIGYACNQFSR